MSLDLKLDSCGDIAIEGGDLVLLSGTAEVVQRILIYLKTWLGGYFFDDKKGVDYRLVFTKGTTEEQIKEIFRKVIVGIEGVDRVLEIVLKEYDVQNRNIKIDIVIIINDELVETTFAFNGQIDDSCYELVPKQLGDLIIWFDALVKEQENQADYTGSYAFEGTASLVGISNINNKRALNANNVLGTEENYISFTDTPFVADPRYMTFFFVVHLKDLSNLDELGLFSTPCFIPELSPPECYWTIKVMENGVASRIITEFYVENSDTTYNNYITVSSLEDSTLILVLRVNDDEGDVFLNGVYEDQISIAQLPWNTSGYGALLASLDQDGGFLDSLNGQIGEFLLYRECLSDSQIVELSSWLAEKWGL